MYHIYEIELKNGEKYVGCTNNIKRRTTQHNDNIKNKRNRFSKYISENYPNLKLKYTDLKVKASFENRKEALKYEKKLTISHIGKCVLLNDNYNIDCSRKGKNLGNTGKNYVLIDIENQTETIIYDLRQYCLNNNLDYKLIQRTVNGNKVAYFRYKVFYYNDWQDIEKKDYYLSGKFYSDHLEKIQENKSKNYAKQYLVKIPNGEIIKVTNLDKFAKENNLTIGTLHSTFKKNKPTKGFQVIKRL